jgi:hypothetical protein
MPSTPGTVNFPTSLDDDVSLIEAANNASSILSSSVSVSDTILSVSSTTTFSSTGALSLEDETIFYTGTTSTTFTGCIRGQNGTPAASHDSGSEVNQLIIAAHHSTPVEAILALERKLGIGSSVASAGEVLLSNTSGSSEWGTLPDATTSSSGLMSAADKVALDGLVVPTIIPIQILEDESTISWDVSDAPISKAKVTLGGNRSLAISGAVNGSQGIIIVQQDDTGSRTLALPDDSLVVNDGNGAVTLSTDANAVDALAFLYDGTNFYWTSGVQFN